MLFLNRPLAYALTMNAHLEGGGAYFSEYLVGVGRGAHSEGYGDMNNDIFKLTFINIIVMSSMAFTLN